MRRIGRSVVLVGLGFVAGVGATVATHALAVTGARVPVVHHYSVAIDEVKQTLVEPQFFDTQFHRTVTMSDGSVRDITLRSMQENGEPVVQFDDRTGQGTFTSYMGPNGTTTNGRLMVNIKDADEMTAQMMRMRDRRTSQ